MLISNFFSFRVWCGEVGAVALRRAGVLQRYRADDGNLDFQPCIRGVKGYVTLL